MDRIRHSHLIWLLAAAIGLLVATLGAVAALGRSGAREPAKARAHLSAALLVSAIDRPTDADDEVDPTFVQYLGHPVA